jgi:hypothetical protein
MLDIVTEDYVMLVEDDAFIFRSNQVNNAFEYVEKNVIDIVAGKRGSCALEIIERAKEVYRTDEHGPNFWPNFLFTKTQNLRMTNENFSSHLFPAHQYIPELDYTPTTDLTSDTFVWASLQLRHMNLTVLDLPQYHLNTDDEPDFINQRNVFDGNAGWCHVGSLSSGIGGFLANEFGIPLSQAHLEEQTSRSLPDYGRTEQEKMELERRVTIWGMAYEYCKNEGYTDRIPDFSEQYHNALMRLVAHYSLNTKRIARRMQMYRSIGL